MSGGERGEYMTSKHVKSSGEPREPQKAFGVRKDRMHCISTSFMPEARVMTLPLRT